MKRYLVSSLALSAFSIVGAVTAAEVALFDREFPLPAGCVLFPAPALVDGYIRIQCEQDLESPTLYLAFLKAEECETREELAPLIQRRVLSQQITGNLKIVASVETLNSQETEFHTTRIFDKLTCLRASSTDAQTVQSFVEPVLSKDKGVRSCFVHRFR